MRERGREAQGMSWTHSDYHIWRFYVIGFKLSFDCARSSSWNMSKYQWKYVLLEVKEQMDDISIRKHIKVALNSTFGHSLSNTFIDILSIIDHSQALIRVSPRLVLSPFNSLPSNAFFSLAMSMLSPLP